MMTATKAKNMADKLLAQSVFRTSAVEDNLNHSYLYDKEVARAVKANLIKLVTKPQTVFEVLSCFR